MPASDRVQTDAPSAGLVLAPFRGLRYAGDVPGGVATTGAPPYDVIDAPMRQRLAANPLNIVHLTLPVSTDGGTDTEADPYTVAAGTLRDWRRRGVLLTDRAPALYVYELTDPSGHVQRGLLGALRLVAPEAGIVLPHENTMAGPVSDRLALAEATDCDLEPIFLIYDGGGTATALLGDVAGGRPSVDVVAEDGVRHRLWGMRDDMLVAAVAEDLAPRRAVIADGHHRYATYLQRQHIARAAGRGAGPWDYGLTFLVDAVTSGPRVEPIHRVLPALAPDVAMARLRTSPLVSTTPLGADPGQWLAALDDAATADATCAAYVLAGAGGAVLAVVRDPVAVDEAVQQADRRDGSAHSAPWRRLAVTVAHRWLLPELLDVPDTEQTVGYEHDLRRALAEAERTGGTALVLRATPVADVLAVAAAGERMPRKSTSFVPKPRSGLVLRDLGDQVDG